jgi:hypothetical protein
MKTRKLTESGTRALKAFLDVRKPGDAPDRSLVDGTEATTAYLDLEIDENRRFATRYDFGTYILSLLEKVGAKVLLSEESDSFWNWLYGPLFCQFGAKSSRFWHYVVTRSATQALWRTGILARSSFEMTWRHGENARVMLGVPMDTMGDMAEQLSSRQNIAHNRGFIGAAYALYMTEKGLIRGAAGRVRPVQRRKPHDVDRQGRGGAACARASAIGENLRHPRRSSCGVWLAYFQKSSKSFPNGLDWRAGMTSTLHGVPVVDIFAGPGGLAEGFSAIRTRREQRCFDIRISIEKDADAHQKRFS